MIPSPLLMNLPLWPVSHGANKDDHDEKHVDEFEDVEQPATPSIAKGIDDWIFQTLGDEVKGDIEICLEKERERKKSQSRTFMWL